MFAGMSPAESRNIISQILAVILCCVGEEARICICMNEIWDLGHRTHAGQGGSRVGVVEEENSNLLTNYSLLSQ